MSIRKWLILSSYIVLVIIIILLLLMYLLEGTKYSFFSEKRGVCMTEACLTVNEVFKEYVDTTLNPCVDFAKFACGKYVKKLEQENKYGSGLEDCSKKGKEIFYKLITKPITDYENKMSQLGKLFHKSCMNKDFIKTGELTAIFYRLEKMGVWPIINGIQVYQSWMKLSRHLHLLGLNVYPIVKAITSVQYGDFRVSIQKGKPIVFDDHLQHETREYIRRLLRANHITPPHRLNTYLTEAYNIGNQMAKILSTNSTEKPGVWKYITDLKKECPELEWNEIVNIPITENDRRLRGGESVEVSDIDVICKLKDILKGNRRAITNYLFISAITELKNKFRSLHKYADITDEDNKRSNECADLTIKQFPYGSSFVFMEYKEKELGSGYRKDINHMFNIEAKNEYKRMLRYDNFWINRIARHKLTEKINHIRFHMGITDPQHSLYENAENFWKIFGHANIRDYDLFNNIINIHHRAFYIMGSVKKVTFTLQLLESISSANVINANAFYGNNQISLTYALTTPLTYKFMGPKFHNYGGIGYVGCHEFGHSIDSEHYNEDATLRKTSMWSKNSEAKFKKKTKCVVDIYNKEYDSCSGAYVNGTLTLQENCADISGILTARRLYGYYLSNHEHGDVHLPNFKFYSSKQMFWLSSSMVLCERRSEESCKEWHTDDKHTRGPHRINMNVKLSQVFAHDWHCPYGSPMNPKHKCILYE